MRSVVFRIDDPVRAFIVFTWSITDLEHMWLQVRDLHMRDFLVCVLVSLK